ncbi:MAG: serine hydrolase domain-containing protein, partial [Gemmataceae bacterium]
HPIRKRFAIMRSISLLLVFALLKGSAPAREPDDKKLAAIPQAMQKFVENKVITGAVTVVGSSRGIARIDATGNRGLNPAHPMRDNTLFRIASMTKPMIAVGVLILADEGKLNVEAPVEKYLPEFREQMLVAERNPDRLVLKKPKRPITIRDLLTHTSGLPNYPVGLGDLYGKRQHNLAEATLAVSQRPLDFEPGSRWAYSNSGIDTLGRIIEVVSGMRCEDFLERRLFGPLGMKDTTFYPNQEQKDRMAGLFEQKEGSLRDVGFVLIGNPDKARHPIPAGGLFSTGPDVARFYQMMLSGGAFEGKQILSPKAVRQLTSLQTGELSTGFTPGMGYGFGFAVVRKPAGVTTMLSPGSFGHGGAFGTQSWADPSKDLFVVLLIQRVGLPNGDESEIRRELQRLAVEAISR